MKQFTAQDIHAAYVVAHEEEGKPPLVRFLADWEYVSERSQAMYKKMAEYLNALQQSQKDEP